MNDASKVVLLNKNACGRSCWRLSTFINLISNQTRPVNVVWSSHRITSLYRKVLPHHILNIHKFELRSGSDHKKL